MTIADLEHRAWLQAERKVSLNVLRQIRNRLWDDVRLQIEGDALDKLEEEIIERPGTKRNPRVIFVFLLGAFRSV